MLRSLERSFKRFVAGILRFVVGSQPVSLSPDSIFHRILVVRQHNQLGDMLCVVPLLRALKAKYPQARIALMTSPVNHDVMLNNRYLSDVIKFDKQEFMGKGLSGWKGLLLFIHELRKKKFDLTIVPATVSTSFTSDFFAYRSGARVRIGASSLNGVRNSSGFFFTNPVELDWTGNPGRHQTLRNLDVANELALPEVDLSIEITLDEGETEVANQLNQRRLAIGRSSVIYHPGAGKIPNRWEASRFAEVANTLSRELRSDVLITSGPMDEEPVTRMIEKLDCPHEIIKNRPIRLVAAILSTARLVITNDTGIMHVAAAVGVPVLSLFGPTDPQQWAPLGVMHRFIKGVSGDMNTITVDEVLRTAREMLHGTESS